MDIRTTVRLVRHCSRLPNDVVDASSLEAFRPYQALGRLI